MHLHSAGCQLLCRVQVNATVSQAREAGALDVRSYTTLIKSCVMRGHVHAAHTVLDEMSSLGMEPNLVCHSVPAFHLSLYIYACCTLCNDLT